MSCSRGPEPWRATWGRSTTRQETWARLRAFLAAHPGEPGSSPERVGSGRDPFCIAGRTGANATMRLGAESKHDEACHDGDDPRGDPAAVRWQGQGARDDDRLAARII